MPCARAVGNERANERNAPCASGGKGSQISAIAGFFEDFWSLGWVKVTHAREGHGAIGSSLIPLVPDLAQVQQSREGQALTGHLDLP